LAGFRFSGLRQQPFERADERLESRGVHRADFPDEPLSAYEAELREDGDRAPLVGFVEYDIVGAGRLVGARERQHPEDAAVEVLHHEHRALEGPRHAVLFGTDVDTEGAPPDFSLVETLRARARVNALFLLIPGVEVLVHTDWRSYSIMSVRRSTAPLR
jgi:hypothetical protein